MIARSHQHPPTNPLANSWLSYLVPVLKIACFSFCDLHANLDQFPLVFLLQQEIPTVASSCPSAERFDDGNLVVLGDTQDTVSLLKLLLKIYCF